MLQEVLCSLVWSTQNWHTNIKFFFFSCFSILVLGVPQWPQAAAVSWVFAFLRTLEQYTLMVSLLAPSPPPSLSLSPFLFLHKSISEGECDYISFQFPFIHAKWALLISKQNIWPFTYDLLIRFPLDVTYNNLRNAVIC